MLDYTTFIILNIVLIAGGLLQFTKLRFIGIISFLIGFVGLVGTVLDPTIIMGYLNNSGVAVAITETIPEFRTITIIIMIFNLGAFIAGLSD
jgi:hypothetical protein